MLGYGILITKEMIHLPTISMFYGIIIQMMFNDNDRHHKPHIHVKYGEYRATISIDGELLAGSIPVKQLKLVLAWIVLHEEELYAAWNKAVGNLPIDKIEPLK